ncbi:unnamed protein product [Bursaphelenchus xylophilus]|uniref:(pine wood nematode) hypothetical protein n=1 Tax=Bursaphelenchus xylophilus TaxID=6326 RepID=A0A1I7RLC0_BURXY|nr:unnamed protein product [Bursaphelenchus xylophilus]CAG9083179.1 unnamed protein product [Bursaphelenchus xylophilus]
MDGRRGTRGGKLRESLERIEFWSGGEPKPEPCRVRGVKGGGMNHPFHTNYSLPSLEDLDWKGDNWKDLGRISLVVFISFLFFWLLQYTVRWYLFGKCTFRTFDYFKFGRKRRRRHVPPSTELEAVPPNKKWRTSNEAVSLIHSVISGLWALYAVLTYPNLLSDMMYFEHPVPKFLIYVSFGYIIHDLLDLLINERSIRILELLFHHIVVIIAFLTTIIPSLFLGVVVLGLLMEVNSIFLHSRSLLNLYRVSKESTAFKFVALLNVLTFMAFRMAVSLYLVYWQITNGWSLEWYFTLLTFVVIFSLLTTNTVLCYRVLAADGLLGARRARPPSQRTETKSSEEDEELDADDEDDEEDGETDTDAARIKRRTSQSAATQTNGADAGQAEPVVVVHQP